MARAYLADSRNTFLSPCERLEASNKGGGFLLTLWRMEGQSARRLRFPGEKSASRSHGKERYGRPAFFREKKFFPLRGALRRPRGFRRIGHMTKGSSKDSAG